MSTLTTASIPKKNVVPPSSDSMPAWARALETRILSGQVDPLDEFHFSPDRLMWAMGLTPDPWQAKVLWSTSKRILLLCSRQTGKSTTAAAVAIQTALLEAPAEIILLSTSLKQSMELFRKMLLLFKKLPNAPRIVRQTMTDMELFNGSRVLSLPENEETVRGYSSLNLLVLDEAARMDEGLYRAVQPMLAVSNGRLIALSTPYGKRGRFFEAWEKGEGWERTRITADLCPRISPQYLEDQLRMLGERWYNQEYMCNFADAVGSMFAQGDIDRALSDEKPFDLGI